MSDIEQRLRVTLGAAYGEVEPSDALRRRCQMLADGAQRETAIDRARPSQWSYWYRERRWLTAGLACAAVITIAVTVTVLASGRDAAPTAGPPSSIRTQPLVTSTATTAVATPPVGTGAASASIVVTSGADPRTLCNRPESLFARFWLLTTMPNDTAYQGAITVGSTSVPALSVYTSLGPPGVGVLCVSTETGPKANSEPIRGVTQASIRPIA